MIGAATSRLRVHSLSRLCPGLNKSLAEPPNTVHVLTRMCPRLVVAGPGGETCRFVQSWFCSGSNIGLVYKFFFKTVLFRFCVFLIQIPWAQVSTLHVIPDLCYLDRMLLSPTPLPAAQLSSTRSVSILHFMQTNVWGGQDKSSKPPATALPTTRNHDILYRTSCKVALPGLTRKQTLLETGEMFHHILTLWSVCLRTTPDNVLGLCIDFEISATTKEDVAKVTAMTVDMFHFVLCF